MPADAQEIFIDLKKILLATDGTKSAINATKYAISLAKIFNAKVRAIFVDETGETFKQPDKGTDVYLKGSAIGRPTYKGLVIARLYAKKNGVTCEEVITTGNVPRNIIESAQEFLPDLIIIGNSEKSGIRRSLGSVADAVMKGTDIPVLVVGDI